jgi:tRNA-specific 2-thiouridylase
VARKDLATNTLWVVQGHDHPWLLRHQLNAEQAHWIARVPPAPGPLTAKTRYRQADAACKLVAPQAERFELDFEQAQWAVTPGQSAVLYQGDVCLGGGVIGHA